MSLSNLADLATICAAAVAILGFGFGYFKYFDMRDRELRWKKTEFLFEQAAHLDGDREINYAVSVLAETDDDVSVNDVFEADGSFSSAVDSKYRLGFDRLLNLLDRLAYAHLHSSVLDISELNNFGWYYHKVVSSNRATKYCEESGYQDIIEMAQKIQ
ncbi:MAG: hypothetical protein JKY86_06435 [Gammaproteobacteria bacterium]|nr:hypothetical protein [Gammaproteobacteria bacterium]